MKKAGKQQEPSRASLREMPEVNLKDGRWQRNPYAARIAKEGARIVLAKPGRPRKGEERGPSIPRSVRFPAQVWKSLEVKARAEGLTLHAALRKAIVQWVQQS